ncbi:MAG: hypothetical protein FJ398_13425 [Verrucomicrobia bacterium]|nr:hypothetical protein [Verrucomicrobiota bacterium]
MTVELLRKRLRSGGPHVVRASDGKEYAIPHPEFVFPEFVLVGRHNLIIEEEDGFVEIVDPLHVVAIRCAPASKGKNGRS